MRDVVEEDIDYVEEADSNSNNNNNNNNNNGSYMGFASSNNRNQYNNSYGNYGGMSMMMMDNSLNYNNVIEDDDEDGHHYNEQALYDDDDAIDNVANVDNGYYQNNGDDERYDEEEEDYYNDEDDDEHDNNHATKGYDDEVMKTIEKSIIQEKRRLSVQATTIDNDVPYRERSPMEIGNFLFNLLNGQCDFEAFRCVSYLQDEHVIEHELLMKHLGNISLVEKSVSSCVAAGGAMLPISSHSLRLTGLQLSFQCEHAPLLKIEKSGYILHTCNCNNSPPFSLRENHARNLAKEGRYVDAILQLKHVLGNMLIAATSKVLQDPSLACSVQNMAIAAWETIVVLANITAIDYLMKNDTSSASQLLFMTEELTCNKWGRVKWDNVYFLAKDPLRIITMNAIAQCYRTKAAPLRAVGKIVEEALALSFAVGFCCPSALSNASLSFVTLQCVDDALECNSRAFQLLLEEESADKAEEESVENQRVTVHAAADRLEMAIVLYNSGCIQLSLGDHEVGSRCFHRAKTVLQSSRYVHPQHPLYKFFNTVKRKKAKNTSLIFIRKAIGDARQSVDTLKRIVEEHSSPTPNKHEKQKAASRQDRIVHALTRGYPTVSILNPQEIHTPVKKKQVRDVSSLEEPSVSSVNQIPLEFGYGEIPPGVLPGGGYTPLSVYMKKHSSSTGNSPTSRPRSQQQQSLPPPSTKAANNHSRFEQKMFTNNNDDDEDDEDEDEDDYYQDSRLRDRRCVSAQSRPRSKLSSAMKIERALEKMETSAPLIPHRRPESAPPSSSALRKKFSPVINNSHHQGPRNNTIFQSYDGGAQQQQQQHQQQHQQHHSGKRKDALEEEDEELVGLFNSLVKTRQHQTSQ